MNTTNLEIYKLRKSYEKWSKILGKRQRKASERFCCDRTSEISKPAGKIWEGICRTVNFVLLIVDIISIAIIGFFLERRMKKELISIPDCEHGNLAMDINELLKNGERTVYYGGCFTYSALIKKGYLQNIKLILGDAHLEALDDIRCFKSLKYVGGTIFYKGKQFHSLQACRKFLEETNNV